MFFSEGHPSRKLIKKLDKMSYMSDSYSSIRWIESIHIYLNYFFFCHITLVLVSNCASPLHQSECYRIWEAVAGIDTRDSGDSKGGVNT